MSIPPTLRRTVRHDASISLQARLLFEDVCDLAETRGECWAGDKHFAETYGATRRTVRRWVSELKDAGYLRAEGATKNRRLIPQEPAANPEEGPALRTQDVLGHRTQGDLRGPDLGQTAVPDLGHPVVDTKSISNTPRGVEREARAGKGEPKGAAYENGATVAYMDATDYTPQPIHAEAIARRFPDPSPAELRAWVEHVTTWAETERWNERNVPTLIRAFDEQRSRPNQNALADERERAAIARANPEAEYQRNALAALAAIDPGHPGLGGPG